MRQRPCVVISLNWVVLSASVVLFSSGVAGAVDGYREALLDAMSAKERALDSNYPVDWQETLRRLQRADSIRASAETKYEMAYAQGELGQADEALENYHLALELGLAGTAANKAKAYIVDKEPSVARVDIHGKPGTRVIVRGIERAQLPLRRPILILPGDLTIEFITHDNESFERQISLAAGQIEIINLDIAKTSQPSTGISAGAQAQQPGLEILPHSPNNSGSVPPGANAEFASASNPWQRAGWLLLGAGTGVGVLGVIFIPTSSSRIASSRQELLSACASQTGGPDSCAHAKSGRQGEAQSASDSIATWKTVRTTAWIGFAAGATGAISGVIMLVASQPKASEAHSLPYVSLDSQHVYLSYWGDF